MTRDLTEGERRVLLAYVEEETHERAAARLSISTQTLKNHLGSIYKKVGARKAHAAVYRLAMDRGCDPLGPIPQPTSPPSARARQFLDQMMPIPAQPDILDEPARPIEEDRSQ